MFVNILFIISSLLTVVSALLALVTKNIMHACVYLLGSLLGIAGLYVTLGADFVAVAQVMVYVGGVVILMLFAVMLTGGKEFISRSQRLLGLIPLMGSKWSYGIATLAVLVMAGVFTKITINLTNVIKLKEASPVESTIETLGKLLITDHVLAFELSSVLLLGALVGAAIIARPRRSN